MRQLRQQIYVLLLLALALCMLPSVTLADEVDDLLAELESGQNEGDRELLADSLFGNLRFWNGVNSDSLSNKQKIRKQIDTLAEAAKPWGWTYDTRTHSIKPIAGSKIPLSASIQLHENGNYRIWLRRRASADQATPVKLTLASTSNSEALFGTVALSNASAREQEQEHRLSFEDLAVRQAVPTGDCWVWEYQDMELAKGDYRVQLMPLHSDAQVSHIFISRSKTFTPSLSRDDSNTLSNVFYRFRIRGAGRRTYQVKYASVAYHWPFKPKGATSDMWSANLGQTSFTGGRALRPRSQAGTAEIAVDEWSAWFDVSWATEGAGSWGTGTLTFQGVQAGICDIQLSWQPHPAAVGKTISVQIRNGTAKFCVPLAAGDRGKWGMPARQNAPPISGFFGPAYLDRFKTLAGFNEQYVSWIKQARDKLGIQQSQPIPAGLRVMTSVEGDPWETDELARTIASMGFNSIDGASPAVCKELGIIPSLMIRPTCGHISTPSDPAWPAIAKKNLQAQFSDGKKRHPDYDRLVKAVFVADEIGAIAGGAKVNASADSLQRFRQYLGEFLRDSQQTPEFFGVESVDQLECLPELPTNAGLFERRLYRHTAIFIEQLTADYYRPILTTAETLYPDAIIFSNFSPVALRQGDQTMNHASWFAQPRQRSVNAAWGEDWSFTSGSFTGYEIVSYYAALVECAARKHQLRSGFFSVPGCGNASTNIVSILSRNIKNVFLFRFGPAYNGTGVSDNWSDSPEVYPELVKALHVTGHVGRTLAEGKIEKRVIAVLYNRDHEMMNGGSRGEQSNRALTFAALANANRNADIILNEDLTAVLLRQYSVIVADGFCLPRRALPVLKQWVADGGLLIGSPGFASRDEYNSPFSEATELTGARQRSEAVSAGYFTPITVHQHTPIDEITIQETEFSPGLVANVIGMKNALLPTTARPIARFRDGSCAAALNTIGDGYVLLWGIQPGILYKGDQRLGSDRFGDEMSRYMNARLALFEKPLSRVLGESPLSTNAEQVELTRFDFGAETAVLINNFRRQDWKQELPPMTIRMKVSTDTQVREASSALYGELNWRISGGWLEITSPMPSSVDSILIVRSPPKTD